MRRPERIVHASLHSVVTLAPLISIAATRAVYGDDDARHYYLAEAIRHARRLVTELELQQLQLERCSPEGAAA